MHLLKAFNEFMDRHPHPSRVVVPPDIVTVLQDQLILAREPRMRQVYRELTEIIRGMGSTILMETRWQDVYRDIPKSTADLTPTERKRRDDEKDMRMIQYFSAWSMARLTWYRRFQVFVINNRMKRPEGCGHVRILLTEGCAKGMCKGGCKAVSKTRQGRP